MRICFAEVASPILIEGPDEIPGSVAATSCGRPAGFTTAAGGEPSGAGGLEGTEGAGRFAGCARFAGAVEGAGG